MNKGIALARGEFISFLNVDDFYEDGALRRVAQLIGEADPTEAKSLFLLGNCRILYGNAESSIHRPGYLRRNLILSGIGLPRLPVNPSAYFYNKALHARVGLYQVDEHESMDLEFILRVLPVATQRYYDEIWGNFRFVEGTKTFAAVSEGRLGDKIRAVIQSFHPALRWHERVFVVPLFYVRRIGGAVVRHSKRLMSRQVTR
jgi:hypothetical protein